MNYFNVEIFGWIAAVCFSLCALPQAVKCFQEKHAHGVSWGLLILWAVGEIFALLYVLPKKDTPLILNYVNNLIFLAVILYYKIKGVRHERNRKRRSN